MSMVQSRRRWDCGDPDCELCHRQPETPYYDDEYDDDLDTGTHDITVAPWRDEIDDLDIDGHEYKSYREVWPALKLHEHINVVEMAADFWVLQGIKGNVFTAAHTDRWINMFVNEGKRGLDALVAHMDRVFVQYSAMAIGGELRHHPYVGELCNHNRSGAWVVWKYYADHVGPQIYRMAADVFRDFRQDGFGGEPWAVAAEILHARLTDKISREIFVDRVLDLQHNGGCFLNKLAWGYDEMRAIAQGNNGIEVIRRYIGPAHASTVPDWNTLAFFASPEARKLLLEYHAAVNKLHRTLGLSPERPITPRHPRERIRRGLANLRMLKAAGIEPTYEHQSQAADY